MALAPSDTNTQTHTHPQTDALWSYTSATHTCMLSLLHVPRMFLLSVVTGRDLFFLRTRIHTDPFSVSLFQLTPLPLTVPGVSQLWWTLCCPVRLVDSLRKALHWLNVGLSYSQCQLKVSLLTLIFWCSQVPQLCYGYYCYYFSSDDSTAYIIHKDGKPIIDIHIESLFGSFLSLSLQWPRLKHLPKHLLIVNLFFLPPHLFISISSLPINKTAEGLLPHKSCSIWSSGLNEIHFYVLQIRDGEAFTLHLTWGNEDLPDKKAGRDEGMGAALSL